MQTPSRLIKRYSNRKLYDATLKHYVTLLDVRDWVQAGEDVRVVDHRTGEDRTALALAVVLLEELRTRPMNAAVGALTALIRHPPVEDGGDCAALAARPAST